MSQHLAFNPERYVLRDVTITITITVTATVAATVTITVTAEHYLLDSRPLSSWKDPRRTVC